MFRIHLKNNVLQFIPNKPLENLIEIVSRDDLMTVNAEV